MLKLIRDSAVVLAAAGIVLPIPTVRAAEPRPAKNRPAASRTVADVKFTSDGCFKGRVIDHEGEVGKKVDVVIRQGSKIISQTRTDDQGVFSVEDLKSGTYQVSSGSTEGNFRVWSDKTAPPSSRKFALLVTGTEGARGQFGAYDAIEPEYGGYPVFDPTIVLMTAGVVAAVVLGAVNLSKINSLQNSVDNLPPVSP